MDILDIAIAKQLAGGGGGSGTDNYNDLSNLPKINDVTLSGNKSSSALGLQSEITSENKLDSDLIDDTDQDNKFVTSSEKNTWNAKQNAIDSDHKLSSDLVDDANHTNKFVTSTEKNTWNAKQNAIDSDHKLSSDLVDDANKTNKFVTSTEKNTWNAKQNAIDADHKLSSSLVSFTTAEAAALASGIDSSKVDQISTNQTNILLVEKSNPMCNELHYNLEDLKKINSHYNYSWNDNVASLSHIEFTINEDNSISWVATNLTQVRWLILYDSTKMPAIASGEYVLHGCPSGGGDDTYELEAVVSGTDKKEYGNPISFTVSNDLSIVAIGIRPGSSSGTFYPVLINKSLYDAGITDYIIPAKPNYDLTVREAEDRNALAEVVDSGAKNLFDISTSIFDNQNGQFSVTYNGSSATIKRISGSAVLSTPNFTVRLDPGTYVLSGCPSNGSDSTYRLDLRDPYGPSISGTEDYGSGSSAFQISTSKTYKIVLLFDYLFS